MLATSTASNHPCPKSFQVALVRASDFYGPGVIHAAMGADMWKGLLKVTLSFPILPVARYSLQSQLLVVFFRCVRDI